jgi:hypothetical protein
MDGEMKAEICSDVIVTVSERDFRNAAAFRDNCLDPYTL